MPGGGWELLLLAASGGEASSHRMVQDIASDEFPKQNPQQNNMPFLLILIECCVERSCGEPFHLVLPERSLYLILVFTVLFNRCCRRPLNKARMAFDVDQVFVRFAHKWP